MTAAGRAVQSRWTTDRFGALAAATVLHGLVLGALLPSSRSPPADANAWGGAVSVTLVAGPPSASGRVSPLTTSFEALERRLSERSPDAAAAAQPTTVDKASGRLSDILGDPDGPPSAQTPADGGMLQSSDDPYSRGSVSYRGTDPTKAAKLAAQATRCSAAYQGARVLLLIDSQGRLTARPQLVSGLVSGGAAEKTLLAAIERCAPFQTAASPGAPRSYEIRIG